MVVQVLIQGGELVMGTLCKKTLGASGGSLIHVIWMEEGPEAARAFLSQTQYLVNHWLLQHGFSIGIGDTVADAATMLIISDIINKACALAARVVFRVMVRVRVNYHSGRRLAHPLHLETCVCAHGWQF